MSTDDPAELRALEMTIDMLTDMVPRTGSPWRDEHVDIVVAIGCLTRIVRRRKRQAPPS